LDYFEFGEHSNENGRVQNKKWKKKTKLIIKKQRFITNIETAVNERASV